MIQDRATAGRDLARALGKYRKHPDVIVLALPRGGVPVATEVAHELHAPLDVLVVRKLGTPGHEEVAMGAVASGGIRVLTPEIVESLGIDSEVIEEVAAREQLELERHRVRVTLIPNMHLETPNYSVTRLRHDDLNHAERHLRGRDTPTAVGRPLRHAR